MVTEAEILMTDDLCQATVGQAENHHRRPEPAPQPASERKPKNRSELLEAAAEIAAYKYRGDMTIGRVIQQCFLTAALEAMEEMGAVLVPYNPSIGMYWRACEGKDLITLNARTIEFWWAMLGASSFAFSPRRLIEEPRSGDTAAPNGEVPA